MRTKYLLISTLLLLAFLLAACGSQATPAVDVQGAVNTAAPAVNTLAASTAVETAVGAVNTLAASTAVQTAAADDLNALLAALQAADVTVESGGAVNQPFFTVQGQSVKVNGQDVQVFVYDTAQAMETEAAQISADASTIGTSSPTWMDAPHFYKLRRVLILYVGQDQTVLEQLNRVLGLQFAGQ
jgi:hypothetical protein